ncbi:hypothetical protein PFDG_00095 [Plasmodium falciparum Dd2]|uniref:Erythrocyte membrane protein 1 n=2 Tax=Plasmodium falciparum TaxID=5833 RepID=A0A0L7LVU5_PLAF4|nr:hypothetical protein PFDG_00095 [Plasmodium falciparum Dd2]
MTPRRTRRTVSDLSARDVLEKIALQIYKKENEKTIPYERELKGTLSNAQFLDGLRKAAGLGVTYGPANSCDLEHKYYTNIDIGYLPARNPCHGRNQNRFSENAEAYCSIDKIRDNGIKSSGGTCVPFRRQNICDKNLEFLDNDHTDDTDDLLGNVLVTAKYEGESIVKNHPNKKTSDVCTALARSFADIGDIVRGRDMFKPNTVDKVHEGLKVVFQKIYDDLKKKGINDYNDISGNYYKLREAWWTVNRDQVWRALTCGAGEKDTYFTYSKDNTQLFSNRQCGHNEGAPPTNLDYVPQFLRWFEEWAEEFCRIKKIKLENVKKACRDESSKLYCSHNGYDCTQTIRNKDICIRESKCTDCSTKCKLYELWLEKQENEFKKQKQKYEKEIQTYTSKDAKTDSNINNEYYKQFYKKLKEENYETHEDFLRLLNEGKYCKKKNDEEEDIDFTKTGDKGIFYRSDYCQVCPHCGVVCNNGTCRDKPNNGNCGNNVIYNPPQGVTPTNLNVLYSADQEGDISNKLSEFCNEEIEKNSQKWQCYYVNSYINACKMEKKNGNNTSEEKITKFHNFFEMWVTYLLTETITWKDKLKTCMNNTKTADCIDECSTNCVCFDKWVKQKEQEWNSIKELLTEEQKNPKQNYGNINIYFESFFFHVMKKLNKEAKWNKLMDELRNKIELSKGNEGTKDLQDAIELLLDHLKEIATICKDNNTNEACASSKESKTNPCAKTHGKKLSTVKQIAQYYKRKAHAQLEERGSRSALKGDASQGQYDRGGKADDFKSNICSITKEHSNAIRNRSDNPCNGKNPERFYTGKNWTDLDKNQKSSYSDVYLPQRREHMCTSNLEYLQTNISPLNGSDGKLVNNSFLGDVLLAAKFEAEKIKELYKTANDEQSVCRAVSRSFADIGDIIKGTDMWDGDRGEIKTQGNLVKIFEKIKEKLSDDIKGKYTGDTEDNKYINLRKDWWEANRHQVWKAMQCPTTTKRFSLNIKCGDTSITPLVDYIPQRLRWMTEWVEWYCKVQKKAYDELKKECGECRSKVTDEGKGSICENVEKCKGCREKCQDYEKKIEPWKQQWTKIKEKYEELYKKAEDRVNSAPTSGDTISGTTEEKNVVEFLSQLHDKNIGSNEIYSTAAGYIHQELPNVGCMKQYVFCSGDNYAFKHPPKEYEDACGCNERNTKPPAKKEEKKDACEIVKGILNGKSATDYIEKCNGKYKGGYHTYPSWKCDSSKIKNGQEGACMPPRRQKLCVINLQYLSGTSKNDLRKAFIECAAVETFFLWHKYKKDKNSDLKPQTELESGKIPDDFKRQMFYTFGDFRDLCLGKDIGKDVGAVNQKMDIIFAKNKKSHSIEERETWWKAYGPHIWEGMLCALSYNTNEKQFKDEVRAKLMNPENNNTYSLVKFSGDNSTTLEEFSQTPQFLRWMTEWGEDFCNQRKKQLEKLRKGCPQGTCTNDPKDTCKIACEYFKTFINQWEAQYKQQIKKYDEIKVKEQYKDVTEVQNSSNVYEYLGKALKKNCQSSGSNTDIYCDCMSTKSSQNSETIPASLDYPPSEINGKCDCTKALPPSKVPEVPKTLPSACEIVETLFKDKDKKFFDEVCNLKYKGGKEKHTQWKCITNKSKNGVKDDEVCIPPRRQKMYIGKLQNFSGKTSHELRKAFIESAAIETFFAWHKYKQEKEKEKPQENGSDNIWIRLFGDDDGDEEEEEEKPQEQLKSGKIPDDFMRQMFYTFGDYKDIFFGKDMSNGKDMDAVKSNINMVFQKIGPKPSSAEKIPIEEQRKQWWNQYGKDIWEGMVCALGYNTDTQKKEENVQKNLIENLNKKNNYKYENVIISAIGPNGATSSNLSKFSEIPQFIRWFEEWTEEFCRKRTYKLKKAKKECRGEYGDKYFDGEGHDCKEPDELRNKSFIYIQYSGCQKECIKYKKWIVNKRNEFNKQKKKFQNEINNVDSKNQNKYDEGVYKNPKTMYPTFKDFVQRLNESQYCNKNNVGPKINFDKNGQTFSISEYCKACPVYGVNYNMRSRKYEPISEATYKKTKGIGENENGRVPKEIKVLVLDRKEKSNDKEHISECKNAGLFEEASFQNWECQKKNRVEQCKLKNYSGDIDDDQEMEFNVFFQQWLRYFVYDYNKFKDKIKPCIKKENAKSNKCIVGCKENLECVKKWLHIKEKEWTSVKSYYETQKQDGDYGIPHWVKSYFELLHFDSDHIKAQDVVDNENEKKTIWGCTGHDHCSDQEKKENKDFITILISKLQKKIDDCKIQHNPSGETKAPCEETPLDDDTVDDDNEKTGDMRPQFCPKEDTTPKEPTPEKKIEKDACEIVKDHFLIYKNGNGENGINGCHPKGGEFKWKCDDDHFVEEDGVCMPPRRQSLCIHDLKVLTNTSSEKQLREAFINCAAKETYFSWHYYKNKYGTSVETQLRNGNIPQEFKRIMYYTFGDYRDICLGTDISSDSNIHVISQKVKDILNSQNGKTHEQNITPKTWWENHGTDIWKGMLCALEYDENKGKLESIPAPEVFAKRVQFLRWFVEWGDEYCQKRGELEKNVKQSCKDVNTGYKKKNNGSCAEACKEYKEYITNKKGEYNTQKDKFQSDKNQKKPGYNNISSEVASDYLKEKCLHKKCDCIGKVNSTSDYWDKPFKTYDDNTLKSNCEFATSPYSSPSQKGKMSCVEQIAKELREKAEKNVEKIDNSMKGNESKFNGTCNLIKKQTDNNGQTTCDFNKRYPNGITSLDSSCDNNGKKRFNIEEEWKCDENTTEGKNKLCIPPRRRDMCLTKLEDIIGDNISDSNTLLEKIQDVAKNEGNDIIKNLLPENPCNESVICDAMKYSFADIGDIIRGRSKIKPNNGDNIEGELQNIFRKIQNNTTSLKSIELTEFRDKWWDANRKEVWKAMTCNAPNDAHLKKKKNNPGNKSQIIASQTEQTKKCSHDSEPPDYDYIPEHYRFLQEWSEYYCKVLKEKEYEMKNECEKCKTKKGMCENDNNILCNKCKDKCKFYKELVNQWKSQFDEQNQIYKQLYMKAKTASAASADSDSSIKFLKKLEDSCNDPYSAEKYLDISTHCTDYKFSETDSRESNYAFSPYPKDYKENCKCKVNTPTSNNDPKSPSLLGPSFFLPKKPKMKFYPKIGIGVLHPFINMVADPITIHETVAKTFNNAVPQFHINPDKTDVAPPTKNILNEVLPSAIPVGIALALGSIAFLFLKVIYIYLVFMCLCVYVIYIYLIYLFIL